MFEKWRGRSGWLWLWVHVVFCLAELEHDCFDSNVYQWRYCCDMTQRQSACWDGQDFTFEKCCLKMFGQLTSAPLLPDLWLKIADIQWASFFQNSPFAEILYTGISLDATGSFQLSPGVHTVLIEVGAFMFSTSEFLDRLADPTLPPALLIALEPNPMVFRRLEWFLQRRLPSGLQQSVWKLPLGLGLRSQGLPGSGGWIANMSQTQVRDGTCDTILDISDSPKPRVGTANPSVEKCYNSTGRSILVPLLALRDILQRLPPQVEVVLKVGVVRMARAVLASGAEFLSKITHMVLRSGDGRDSAWARLSGRSWQAPPTSGPWSRQRWFGTLRNLGFSGRCPNPSLDAYCGFSRGKDREWPWFERMLPSANRTQDTAT